MARFVRISMLAGLVGILAASLAVANIPQRDLSNVPKCLAVSPDGLITYTVEVNGPTGAVNGADVEITVTGDGTNSDALVSWCVGQTHPVIIESTDANGEADFNIAGGGCVDASRLGEIVYRVTADGVPIGVLEDTEPHAIVSPDAVNESGELPTDAGYSKDGNPGGARVTLSDAVFHTGPIVNPLNYEQCTDFNSDGTINVSDAVIVTPYIIGAINCDRQ